MGKVTSKNLFSLVADQIEKRSQFQTTPRFSQQLQRSADVAPFSMSSNTNTDVSASELLGAIQAILNQIVAPRIISGLTVVAQDPISSNVVVAAGTGTVNGSIFEVTEDTIVPIPFDSVTTMFYVVLSRDTIMLEKATDSNKLTLAKIVVPYPSLTNVVQDDRDDSYNAYIMQYQEYKLYGNANGKFEEDTKELFKDNIGSILAETIVGTITLNDNLKITNIAGTLALDSTSMVLSDYDGHMLSKFNQRGVFFYDSTGVEIAKFATDEAHVGNITILPNSIQSGNFVYGAQGFRIQDTGNTEFNDLIVRGTVYATAGVIGGFTILSDRMYGGKIMTASTVASGSTGVIMDTAGLRGYDAVLGLTFNLPTNGGAPTFSSGIINYTAFEVNTNAVIRTATAVGDGSALSYGILINNTGLYGCGANQTLANANLRALIDGTIRLSGEINASTGQIGNVTITSAGLFGGLIQGTSIISNLIQTSATVPRIRIDAQGIYYQATSATGKYGQSASGGGGHKYFDGTKYGSGVVGYLFNPTLPPFTITSSLNVADIRLFNRVALGAGPHKIGDIVMLNGAVQYCTVAGSPGTFTSLVGPITSSNSSLSDPNAAALVGWNDQTNLFGFVLEGYGIDIETISGANKVLKVNVSDLATQMMLLTTNQGVSGIKTFGDFPLLPGVDPTSDLQVAHKKYVDFKMKNHSHTGADADKVRATNLNVAGIGDGQILKNSGGTIVGENYTACSFKVNLAGVGGTDTYDETGGYDTGSNFASNTFTAPVTGRYLFCIGSKVSGAAESLTSPRVLIKFLKVNGSTVHETDTCKFHINAGSGTCIQGLSMSVILNLSSGDTVTTASTEAANWAQTVNDISLSWFSGALLNGS